MQKLRLLRWLGWIISFAAGCGLAPAAGAAGAPDANPAEHVVLIVWDGMRPDFISPRGTPNLWSLRTNGVFFASNHCAYISTTEVNGTALATGTHPGHSGVIANKMYWPHLNVLEPLATESVDTIRRCDSLTGGHYLGVQTIAETVQQAGFPTSVAGAKDVVLLHDRANPRLSEAGQNSKVLHAGRTLPASLKQSLNKSLGKEFPAHAIPNNARDEWTTRALTDSFWKDGVPKFSVLWLSEPDASQHEHSPGSSNALAGITSSDRQLGYVLTALEKKRVRQTTDIFVVSDHGFSSAEPGPDVADLLRKAGFAAYRKFDDPEPGEVLVVGLGGSTMFYVVDHDAAVTRRLVEFLQGTDFAGVIFTKQEPPLPGTFALSQVRLDPGTAAPDVVLSFRWTRQVNEFGAPGMIAGDGLKKGTGSHGSLSPYDLHNTLVGSGPHLRHGFVDELPSGNIDVAPTILSLLGIKPSGPLDGRVLREAMRDQPASTAAPQVQKLQTTANVKAKTWRQYLKVLTFEGAVYFAEGNSE